ncbi:zinc-dependent metalloprotease family protein [Humisphaera borealis]|uniref:Peptidase M11 gametolysin domain-containing protein n=1 Tax=Humisphaera borealis TaxID=2807512 RepID=A0A7M2WXH8_9BACT|nr:zinc-dependent metalloprotease family protein [Humisphaera borealis]QOV89511.1 hypothetical protein IPV69_25510 [Humisphaera borealis]
MSKTATCESLESRTLFAATGTRDLLYVNVRFSDQTSYPLSTSAATTQAREATDMIENFAAGNLSYTYTVKSVALSKTTAYYKSGGTSKIAEDTDAALRATGYSTTKFEHISYRFAGVSGSAGLGQVGGKRIWLRSNASTVLAHEMGHNLGLYHSSLANPKGSNPFGSYDKSEYGDVFSNMGYGGSKDWSAGQKYFLGWLGGSRSKFVDAAKAGTTTVDLTSHDDATSYASSNTYLVRIKISSTTVYTVEYRKGLGGVLIHRTPTSLTGGLLLDATPSTETASDAALKFGKSLTDTRSSGSADDVKISVVQNGSKAKVTVKIGG